MKKSKPSSRQQPATALTIVQGSAKPLSKKQQEFNRLTSRIEKLRKEFELKQKQFDEALELYGKKVVPLDEKLARQSERLLHLLFPIYQKAQLPKTLQPHLKEMLRGFLQSVLQNLSGEPPEELKEMFRYLEGERFETAKKREEKMMKAEMEDMFKMWGMDVTMDDTSLDDENFAGKMAEIHEQMNKKMAEEQTRREASRKTGRKTARQLEKEKAQAAAEQMKQKSISTVYRQLAKLLHPDLERDETLRAEKQTLMQEVTTAYEAKDLHTLLLLELKWIHQEQNHLETVADEKLVLYLQVLREQTRSLEEEKWQLINHPRYHLLLARYGYQPLNYPVKAVKDDLHHLEVIHQTYQVDLELLQRINPLPHIKSMVNQWKKEKQFLEDEYDLLAMLLSMDKGKNR